MQSLAPQRGLSAVEAVVAISVACLLISAGVAAFRPFGGGSDTAEALAQLEVLAQRARVEAVQRQRACRLVLDTTDWSLRVLDSLGTADERDDDVLLQRAMPAAIRLGRPDGGSPSTFARSRHSAHELLFTARGNVPDGPGELVLSDGQRYGRLRAQRDGTLAVETWDGRGWVPAL